MQVINRYWPAIVILAFVAVIYFFFFRRPSRTIEVPSVQGSSESTESYEVVTVLPRDAIPAIDNPQFYTVADADEEYVDQEMVLGVSLEGEKRAYSTTLLNRHEIVNDTVGGHPIAVTW